MKEQRITLKNEEGLHARPAAIFVRLASRFNSDITIESNGITVDGKSIIGIMSLGAFCGEEIKITAKGNDENVATKALVQLIQNNFEI
ncbi:MAG: HPr family phosphocarrier protein [Tissierellia bacterium]|nr:HPr family phosphocarrier protein [Tissierellia bacterium]